MLRVVEYVHGRAHLDNLARIHDRDSLRDFGDHSQIMRNQNQRKVIFFAQTVEEFEDLSLDRDVERRRRLIRNDQRWTANQRHRDHDALTHAARQVMGIIFGALFRIGNRHGLHGLYGASPGFAFRYAFMGQNRFGDLKSRRSRRDSMPSSALEKSSKSEPLAPAASHVRKAESGFGR